jgi:hypothetical protein
MLVAIAVENMRPVLALLPKLDTLASEGWWEVHGQLGRLCGALLAPERKAELADENATVVVVQLCAKVRRHAKTSTAPGPTSTRDAIAAQRANSHEPQVVHVHVHVLTSPGPRSC